MDNSAQDPKIALDLDELNKSLQEANRRLKTTNTGVVIEIVRSSLYLRAVLPPKPYSDIALIDSSTPLTASTSTRSNTLAHISSGDPKAHRQRIALNLRATLPEIKRAEQVAKLLSSQYALGQFDWLNWGVTEEQIESAGNVAYWATKYEEQHWKKTKKTKSTENTWKIYKREFDRLPQTAKLTTSLVLKALDKTNPDSRARQKQCDKLIALLEFVNLPNTKEAVSALTSLRGNYSNKSVSPRDLPSEERIIEVYKTLPLDWRWIYGTLAVYGLRPHELFGLDFTDFPTIRTHSGTKRMSEKFKPTLAV